MQQHEHKIISRERLMWVFFSLNSSCSSLPRFFLFRLKVRSERRKKRSSCERGGGNRENDSEYSCVALVKSSRDDYGIRKGPAYGRSCLKDTPHDVRPAGTPLSIFCGFTPTQARIGKRHAGDARAKRDTPFCLCSSDLGREDANDHHRGSAQQSTRRQEERLPEEGGKAKYLRRSRNLHRARPNSRSRRSC